MQCNIDAKGKAARLKGGIGVLIMSIIVTALAFFIEISWLIYPAIILAFAGLFMIFEARKGWCALRALGFKTPL